MKKIKDIVKLETMTRDQFFTEYYEKEPVVMTGLINDWPAREKWTPEYFRDRYGDVTVGVETYDPNSDLTFLDHYVTGNCQAIKMADFVNDMVIAQRQNVVSLREEMEIFDTIPELRKDIDDFIPFGTARFWKPEHYKALWLGPAGYVTGLHADHAHLLLFQIYGRKYIKFLSPDQSPYLYEDNVDKLDNADHLDDEEREFCRDITWGGANVLEPDFEAFPLLEKTMYLDGVLEPGEVLYVPDRWWHSVRSLDASISVSTEITESLFMAERGDRSSVEPIPGTASQFRGQYT